MTRRIKFTNIGVAINRKFKKVDRMDDQIIYLQKKIKLMEKARNDMEERLLTRLEHQSNYIINLEKRIEKLETQPSIEGDRLLKVLEDINKKTVFQEAEAEVEVPVSSESIFGNGPERIF